MNEDVSAVSEPNLLPILVVEIQGPITKESALHIGRVVKERLKAQGVPDYPVLVTDAPLKLSFVRQP